ncbi:glycosyltransferase [Brevibacterium gallinarum]|uniref:CDP-glycerol glycerophosphotransferase family protein n=1 Tax=Brevibacterium gallinarum TaxID=2762220 RepID=A0ABR8WWL3_9MICO|nr:glycosyltransferase [Brevibacterium gallinarum]MBD8021298.1 CDP-glycerol glycerophosphotransferase family protein [Brevibacterium gallinarum]
MALGKIKRAVMRRLPTTAAASLRAARPRLREQAGSAKATISEMRRWVGRERRARAFRTALAQPVDPQLVLWESFGGNGALCNPEALFRHVIAAADLSHLTHVWALRPQARADAEVVAEFADHPRVRIVDYRSPEYFALLERAGYLVNNATFPREFIKRPEQVYLNTWHGTPMKTMGYDEPDGPLASVNVLRNLLAADVLLSSGPYMTETMYCGAYRLAPIFSGTIVEDGFPRIDAQLQASSAATAQPHRQKTVLYAPTWRGESFQSPRVETQQLAAVLDALDAVPALAGWSIKLKVHQAVYAQAQRDPRLAGRLVANSTPTNTLLAQTDLLITDFSSIWMDALASEIPIVYFAGDYQEYLAERGSYLAPEELPGPIAQTLPDLTAAVTDCVSGAPDPLLAERYAACRRRFVPHDDGRAAARLADVVFLHRPEAAAATRRLSTEAARSAGEPPQASGVMPSSTEQAPADPAKTRIVMYPGGLKPNGISSSALNLLATLDRSRFDLTVVVTEMYAPERTAVRACIPHDVRIITLPKGLIDAPLAGSYTQMLEGEMPPAGSDARGEDDALWAHEWRRFVGDAVFDVAIDFSGYSGKWTRLIAVSGAPRRLVWQHNDLAADARREIDGVRPYQRTLSSVFALYPDFDALVSVSPALQQINEANLARFAAPADGTAPPAFLSVRNTIDAAAILTAARGDVIEPSAAPAAPDGCGLSVELTQLRERYGGPAVAAELERIDIRERLGLSGRARGGGAVTTFVTMGRMSPEKNHRRLIEAFNQTLASGCDARLILLGSGPLEAQLREQAATTVDPSRIVFAGHHSNPHPVLDAADCFVLSSDYEGQPMVILEALTLGKPVITTAFGSVDSAFPDEHTDRWGAIVDCDADDLAAAMTAFARDHAALPQPDFDPVAYNAAALDEFAAAVTGDR